MLRVHGMKSNVKPFSVKFMLFFFGGVVNVVIDRYFLYL